MNYWDRIASIDRIVVGKPDLHENRLTGKIEFFTRAGRSEFKLEFNFGETVEIPDSLASMILAMPVLNFSYFAREVNIEGAVSSVDLELLREFSEINSVEVFINKICRRRYEFIKREYVPSDAEVTAYNARGACRITGNVTESDWGFHHSLQNRVAVLSSGGKESLLSYGMLRETGADVYPVFINESGGHWRTALKSYRYFSEHFPNVRRVWTNVDRFYAWALDFIEILDRETIRKRADTYPVQLFIFPVYVFAAAPLLLKYGISGILLGNEFDDPREMGPYRGIKHYYGVFDQSEDFATMVNRYMDRKSHEIRLWSAVYPIAGNVVEKALMLRYHDLFLQQRSCHSCHFSNGDILPCGKCTKCYGIYLFISAQGGNPAEIGYTHTSMEDVMESVKSGRMRLDPDESRFLLDRIHNPASQQDLNHVTGIHLLDGESTPFFRVPEIFRSKIQKIISQYSDGIYALKENHWIRTDNPD
ncbi:MAG: metal-binding protein [Candidatus Thermoplasmatota archaeon]|jgi:hypothetical protein|nr:metal-binding protein [Candidatus Thermoplasmatota archaeon]MCL5793258.1 metal-binding protein [Candidatus Thermoplasmatota archaeon]